MSCERIRAAIADGLLVRDADASDAVDRHVEWCAECRAYRDECRSLWSALGALPAPLPERTARARFDSALISPTLSSPVSSHASTRASVNSTSDSTHKRRARTSRWIQFAVMAACLALAALAGYGTAMWQKPTPTLATSAPVADTTPQFLLLLYDAPVQGAKPSASEETALIAEYAAWARDLFKKGQMVTAEKLVDNGGQWLGGPAVATDGQTIGGFFLIRAPDATEARRIAATCPHLKHGGRVELRAIQPT